MRLSTLAALAVSALLCVTACTTDGTLVNPFSSDDSTPVSNYYFAEFPDIPIPTEFSEDKSSTFITFAPSGLKCGIQRFSGRVEIVSLMNTMRRSMASNGWTLRSLLRSKESLVVFEKPDRIASIQLTDGMFTTEMRIFVSSKLEGDHGAQDSSSYLPTTSGLTPGQSSSLDTPLQK